MQVTVIAAGTAVIFFTAVDFVWTALSMRGAGPLTGRLPIAGWRLLFRLPVRRNRSRWLMAAAPIILIADLISGVALIWAG